MYTSLRKLYYKDQKKQKELYNTRFNSDQTIKIDFYIDKHQAFFVECQEVTRIVYNILKNDKEVSNLCKILPNIALQQYTRKCLIDEIVLTNDIEGVYSSRKEINEVLDILEKQTKTKNKRNRFIGLVKKYLKLTGNETIKLNNSKDIRKLYDEIVLEEVISENKNNMPDGKIFRKEISEITTATGKVLHKGLYPEEKIISNMDKALEFLNNNKIPYLYRICIFHYIFEYIHPFYDGNGRIGRFILSYCISKETEPLLSYKLSETISENIKKYYDAFAECNDRNNLGDLTPFLIIMLEIIDKSLIELKNVLLQKISELNTNVDKIPKLKKANDPQYANLYYILVQASLFAEEGITKEELLYNLKISKNTLLSRLKTIDSQGILMVKKIGKQNAYSIDLNKI